jgi:23S rRNA (cytosine1962-C5)-methyltransferase
MSAYDAVTATLNRQGMTRWRSGHPWIYRAGLELVEESTGNEPLATIHDPKGRFLGQAVFSRESQITLRILTRREAPVDRAFFKERIASAVRYRERELVRRDAMRLVFGESDGLPGLVVDRYGDHLVVQYLSAGMDALADEINAILLEVIKPESILARNDPAVRGLEGLPREVRQVHGRTPPILQYHEGDLVFNVDPHRGQKTGTFLDQYENHRLAGRLAHGKVLDAFSYTGGFALSAAGSAEEVTAVDSSSEAMQAARRNAKRNGIENVTYVEANVFDYLKQQDRDGAAYDLVILDPPAFAKNKRELGGALRGYKEVNLRAMKILRPGGILITCSCSYHLTEALMEETLVAASVDAHRSFRVLERRQQAPDHPVRLGFPESLYLKCQVLELLD